MARKKMEIKYITDDAKRKASFKKRRSGLLKQVREICTLCDVQACIVTFSSNNSEEPVVWPSPSGVETVISKFLQKPEQEQTKKMLNQETYLTQKVEKNQDKLEKLRSENRKKEMNNLMIQCLVGDHALLNIATMVDLNDLTWVINQNLMEITNRLSKLEAQEGSSNGVAAINGDQEEQQVQPMDAQFTNITINGGDEVQQQPLGDDFANNNNNLQNDDDYVPAVPFSP